MELRTKVNIETSPRKIGYSDRVMLIGSCFASSIGSMMDMGRLPVMINPAGSVYNPVSVCNTLDTVISGKEFLENDLGFYNGTWFSFNHNTEFSSEDPTEVLEKINNRSGKALGFLNEARFLFITLGTARVYRLLKTGRIVSNCHKLPAGQFQPELLKADDIVSLWSTQLDTLHARFPQLNVVFTISPVRHWKDGAHGNQVSKSVLFIAVEELLKHPARPAYFPAYELVMDDLRDYRFYDTDMLHLSPVAIDYIWKCFAGAYLDNQTLNIWNEVVKISKACSHRLGTGSGSKIKEFAESMLSQISDIEAKVPSIDLSSERSYFINLISQRK